MTINMLFGTASFFSLSVSDGDSDSMFVKRYGKVPLVLIPTRNLSGEATILIRLLVMLKLDMVYAARLPR